MDTDFSSSCCFWGLVESFPSLLKYGSAINHCRTFTYCEKMVSEPGPRKHYLIQGVYSPVFKIKLLFLCTVDHSAIECKSVALENEISLVADYI